LPRPDLPWLAASVTARIVMSFGCTPYVHGARANGHTFSCSMPAPATSSRHLYTGHRQGNRQAAPQLRARPAGHAFVPGVLRAPGFGAIVPSFDASAVVHTCSSSRRTPD